MHTTVLLSIKPEFAEKIFSGEKQFEFRRTLYKSAHVKRVVVYASSPVRRVIGEFEASKPLSMTKHALWKKTRRGSGVSWQVFSEYFDGKHVCHAIPVRKAVRYKSSLTLKQASGLGHPPQSFAYISEQPENQVRETSPARFEASVGRATS